MLERRTALLATPALLLAACAEQRPALHASTPLPDDQQPGWYRYKLGGLTVTMVTDGFGEAPVQGFVVNKPLAEVQAAFQANFLPTDKYRRPYNMTVVETRRGYVVFDTGTGPQAAGSTSGKAMQNLRAAGIDPARVSTVVISHVHGDHINGLTTAEGLRAFPNAELVICQTEYRWWTDQGNITRSPEYQRGNFANVARRFQPYADRIRVIRDNGEVMPGIRAVPAFGHTPGHSCFVIADGNASMMYVADCTNRPVPLALHPDFHIVFDFDGAMAERSRRRIYDMVSADRTAITGFHFPFPAHGHMVREGQGYRFRLADWQSQV